MRIGESVQAILLWFGWNSWIISTLPRCMPFGRYALSAAKRMLPNVITPLSIAFPFQSLQQHHYYHNQFFNCPPLRVADASNTYKENLSVENRCSSFPSTTEDYFIKHVPSNLSDKDNIDSDSCNGDEDKPSPLPSPPSVMNVLPAVVKTEPNLVLSPSPHHQHHHHHHHHLHHHSGGDRLSPVHLVFGGSGSPCSPSSSPTNITNSSTGSS